MVWLCLQDNRRKQDSPNPLASPIERFKRAFKPGAPAITGEVPPVDVPFVHMGGELAFYLPSKMAHS